MKGYKFVGKDMKSKEGDCKWAAWDAAWAAAWDAARAAERKWQAKTLMKLVKEAGGE